jgi:putative tryptophan/tyrosine transport system substrate-binding protein
MSDLRRRDFITLLGGAAAAWPLSARAAGLRPRIAVLSINSAQQEDRVKTMPAFVDGLRALGHFMDQNIDIDYRYADGDTTRLKPLAQELIALKPDVALANSPSPAIAVKNVAPILPIVCPLISDFLVPSLAAMYRRHDPVGRLDRLA